LFVIPIASPLIGRANMPKPKDDLFIRQLWDSLVTSKLTPAGGSESWEATPARIRAGFARAVRRARDMEADKIPVHSPGEMKGGKTPKPRSNPTKKSRRSRHAGFA
jgi:hypothetical protein